jgi:hypothetical protein
MHPRRRNGKPWDLVKTQTPLEQLGKGAAKHVAFRCETCGLLITVCSSEGFDPNNPQLTEEQELIVAAFMLEHGDHDWDWGEAQIVPMAEA